MRGKSLCVILALVIHGSMAAAEVKLPGDGFAPGWSRAGNTRAFIGLDLFNHIDGGAEIFLEFGFRKLQVQRYGNGRDEIALEAYEMNGPGSALAIYLQRKGKETAVTGVALRHTGDRYQITALRGRLFFQVSNSSGDAAHLPTMATLLNLASAGVAEEAPLTPLDLLPAEDRVPGSERLIRGPYSLQSLFTLGDGDILGLDGKIWAAAADYRARGITFTFLLVPYDNAGAASAAFTHLSANLDPYLKILSRGEKEIIFSDHKNEFGRVELRGERLLIRLHLKEIGGK